MPDLSKLGLSVRRGDGVWFSDQLPRLQKVAWREDRITDADVEAVARWLYQDLDWQIGTPLGEFGDAARSLLSRVLGCEET